MSDYHNGLPKKRMGAGALIFNERNELLIVKPSYKDNWSIPGGVVDKDESPRNACIREVKEEVGIDLKDVEFLCTDYTPADSEKNESIQFIFFGGRLNSRQVSSIYIDSKEILEYKFVNQEEAITLLGGPGRYLARRLPKCLNALQRGVPIYLESGK